jgi:hypothetical protein
VGCTADAGRDAGDRRAQASGQARAGAAGASSARRGAPDLAVRVENSGPALDVKVELDAPRAVRRVMSRQGGSLTATGGDGSTFKLTIPPGALVGDEEIVLTPVTGVAGLPPGATVGAGVQMAPDGLLLLKPATLVVEAKHPVAGGHELPIGWTRQGEGVHAESAAIKTRVPTFTITHFSGVAVADATSPAAESIIKGQALPCGDQFFAEFARLSRDARQAALIGESTPDADARIVQSFVDGSRRYLDDALKPVVTQAETDDALLPCAQSALFAWDHFARSFLGDSFDSAFGPDAQSLLMSTLRGVANSFSASYEKCMRDESPLFQLSRMAGAAQQLEAMNVRDLLPPDAAEKIVTSARTFDYRADVEIQMDNVYNEQGQGIDVATSRTTLTARGIIARYDQQSSPRERLAFVAQPVPAEASVMIEPRKPCPDQARVQPGSTIGLTIRPIMNPRVGELRCEGGKAKCDSTDVDPGVLVELAPQIVENTYGHAYTGNRCEPAAMWTEFMMFHQGFTAVAGDMPFQVRGAQRSATVVRYGSSVRRVPVDVPPQILAMKPGMKDYVEVRTPAIRQAIDRTRVSIQPQQR